MRRSVTERPPWVDWAVQRWEADVSFQRLAVLLAEKGNDVPWHQIRNEVQKRRAELERGPKQVVPDLLPWVLPRAEHAGFIAPRLALLVRRHRGEELKPYAAKRAESLLYHMRVLQAEVLRWDGSSWESRGRREDDQGFDPQWFPDLIVR